MNSTVRKTIIFFSIIFIPFIVAITCPVIAYVFWIFIETPFKDSGPSIEKNGLEGCDTVPLAGDKEQLAEAFMANVDATWTELHRNNVVYSGSEYIYVNDYNRLCFKRYKKKGKYCLERLSVYPSKYYKSYK